MDDNIRDALELHVKILREILDDPKMPVQIGTRMKANAAIIATKKLLRGEPIDEDDNGRK